MARLCIFKLFFALTLAGCALSLSDPVHYGRNVQMFTSECSPSTTTATTTTTTTLVVTISRVGAGGQTTETADAAWTTLAPIFVTNTTTSTVQVITSTATAYLSSGATSDCVTVTVTSMSVLSGCK